MQLQQYNSSSEVHEFYGLKRDKHSNSIVNTDRSAYEKALRSKKIKKEQIENVHRLTRLVEDLVLRVQSLEEQTGQLKRDK